MHSLRPRRKRAQDTIVALAALMLHATTVHGQPAEPTEEEPPDEVEKQACLAAFEAAQQLRANQKLVAAREELVRCGQASCPGVVREKCVEWLPEVDSALPSLLVAVKDRRGEDAVDVEVRIDGELVTRRLDGSPIPVDPGPHTLQVTIRGSKPKDKRIVAQQGDKLRRIELSFATAKPKPKNAATDEQIAALARIALPETLPYKEGQEVPPGYEKDSRILTGLVVGGAVTFSVAWLVSIFVAAAVETPLDPATNEESRGNVALYVPLAGPFIALGTLEPSGAEAFTLIVDGTTQVAGVAMIFAGIFARETFLVRKDKKRVGSTERSGTETSVVVTPTGAFVTGSF
jgi:hypothetical protein